ncbi:Fe-S biogenesis protein NfuA [Enterobacteriaceae endosymbiont of Donacia versicolorea]|uniref:NifU family protein n=1 Tax=Enterobacteriaceae endosymbiont of Donacia versicolorea TaxID=2675788 RepID=UPI001448EB78|nr:NifU family protein [Enterobacteriaceae endosymbiont of Donacia versicolorea]QJC32080.1 Fe-S biogenesis protein NfuA [Enterobacteriaceae endosymbiont of Donacia versicolorea]
MLQITESAQKYFLNLLSNKDINTCIRILVLKKNNLFKGNISFCNMKKIKNDDIKLKFKKFSIFIEINSFKFLENVKIDFIKKKLEFVILKKKYKKNNLKIKNLKKNIQIFIKNIINPKLLLHGGFIILKEITINNILLLEFHGGCQGCAMSQYTLKNKIEKELLNNFPSIKGVYDITLHKKHKFSYY